MTDTGNFGPAYSRPAWAVTDETGDDGEMVFRDGAGQPLLAIAFTEAELRLLRLGLLQLPQDEYVRTLHDRLRDDIR